MGQHKFKREKKRLIREEDITGIAPVDAPVVDEKDGIAFSPQFVQRINRMCLENRKAAGFYERR